MKRLGPHMESQLLGASQDLNPALCGPSSHAINITVYRLVYYYWRPNQPSTNLSSYFISTECCHACYRNPIKIAYLFPTNLFNLELMCKPLSITWYTDTASVIWVAQSSDKCHTQTALYGGALLCAADTALFCANEAVVWVDSITCPACMRRQRPKQRTRQRTRQTGQRPPKRPRRRQWNAMLY